MLIFGKMSCGRAIKMVVLLLIPASVTSELTMSQVILLLYTMQTAIGLHAEFLLVQKVTRTLVKTLML